MNPIFDPEKLTDEELLDKMMKCYVMLDSYQALGHNEMCDSVRLTIETLQFEKDNREVGKFNTELKKSKYFNDPIELGNIEDINELVERARKLK